MKQFVVYSPVLLIIEALLIGWLVLGWAVIKYANGVVTAIYGANVNDREFYLLRVRFLGACLIGAGLVGEYKILTALVGRR